MKILIVASDFPWPQVQGGHLRLATAIEALADPWRHGSLFLLRLSPDGTHPAPNDYSRTAQDGGSWRNPAPAPLADRMADAAGHPPRGSDATHGQVSRLEFESWAADRYDLVWFDRAATFECMGRPHLGPTIIDLHDLEDVKARSRARIIRAGLSRHEGAASLRQAVTLAQTRLNARDWRQFQRSVAGDVDRVVLCSELDVRRSGLANVVIVPNTYQRPERPLGHLEVGQPAVVLFQATFDYAPNVDAAEWLVAEVAPRMRARLPDVEVRLVGTPVPGVQRQHRPPAITVVGLVPAMEPELARPTSLSSRFATAAAPG